jgi:hypothetical protein
MGWTDKDERVIMNCLQEAIHSASPRTAHKMSLITNLKIQVLEDRYISETKLIDLLDELFGQGCYEVEVSSKLYYRHLRFSHIRED